jgi:hypothetical protein
MTTSRSFSSSRPNRANCERSVGFCASLLTGKDQPTWSSPANRLFIAASGFFVCAVVLSMCLMWTRLQDFRLTADKLRMDLRDLDKDKIKIVAERLTALACSPGDSIARRPITFGLGMAFWMVSPGLSYGHRLFPSGAPVSIRGR